ncbi:MAG: nicotinate-nucleotide adenylyltransferase [Bacteroidia bacterium]|nr:nicotinate-nucleotide adenylyltransferase [Bacteroidia bacterium]NNF31719.1 nicotinate-nucleotide adenylyltransferase [Flavobacteriaceae bacterium]NNJ81120.1 nicotinate-nucleotide adenylyltransferase [Flavobacteriaceae bacterium]NNK55233.1 nicotinate-nucleotide adenylyltransferase [Flavobacteriaceae bacterium]NNM10228.1 nicotinate-nucleotide adenylyltransferase [Flavobacteriaceae bacterium]
MKKIVLIALLIGFIAPMIAQEPEPLDEIIVTSVNYRYLSAVENSKAPIPVWSVEKEAAMFDVTDSDVFLDDFNTYHVTFRIPDGVLVAAYDQDGEIIKTIERYKNIQMPDEVKLAIKDKYPNYEVVKDIFKVTYSLKKGANKEYRVKLKNGDKIIRVTIDDAGNFM